MRQTNSTAIALLPPDQSLRIRPVQASDGPLIHRHLWHHRSLEHVDELIGRALKLVEQRRGVGIVVEGDTQLPILAYGQLTRWTDCAEISDLIVHESQRGRGIGTAMIQYLVGETRRIGLSCAEIGAAESNPRALALYRRLGFVDRYVLQATLDTGTEHVIYLRLKLPDCS